MFATIRKLLAPVCAVVLFVLLLPACGGGGGSSSLNPRQSDPDNNEEIRAVGLSASEMQTARNGGATEIRILQIAVEPEESAAAAGAQDGASTVTLAVISIDAIGGDTFSFDVKIGENGEWLYRVIAVDDKGTADTADDVEVAKSEIRITVTTIPTSRADKILAVSRDVLPDYATEILQDDTQIRLAASGNPADGTTAMPFSEIKKLTFTHLPYTGADYINAESTTDLASHWWLLAGDTEYVRAGHDNGEPTTGADGREYLVITVGILYRAGGDKMVVPILLETGDSGGGSSLDTFMESHVTAVIGLTLTHQGQAPLADIFGGGDYGITLADYDDTIPPELAESFSEDSVLAVGDDYDYLAFQNQYSMFGVWMLPSISEPSAGSFVYGLQTPESRLPTSGTATYRGVAAGAYVIGAEFQDPGYFAYGTSEFTADFANAEVAGKITVSAFDYAQAENALEHGGGLTNPQGKIGMEFSGVAIGDDMPIARWIGAVGFATNNAMTYSADNIAADLGVFALFKKDGANEFADDVYPFASGKFFGFNADEITGSADLEFYDSESDVSRLLEFGFTADRQ